MELCQGYRLSDLGPEPAIFNVVNDQASIPMEAKAMVLKRARMSELWQARAGLRAAGTEADLRTIAVLWNNWGERQRSWESLAEKRQEDVMKDWPLSGPRTILWLMRHALKKRWLPERLLDGGVAGLEAIGDGPQRP